MNSNKITFFKSLSLTLWVMLLGACAAPGYSPIVEELSVQARVSENVRQNIDNARGNNSRTAPKAELVKSVVIKKVKPYMVPKAQVIVTAQPNLSEGVVTLVEQKTYAPAKQEAPLPVSGQMVVEQLLAKADQLKAQGKVTEAVIQLQRAQRIAPREPKVYARLSALQLSLGKASRAEQLALKGLTLVPNKKTYQYYFWKLIAASRSYLGDSQGETKAIAQAARYK